MKHDRFKRFQKPTFNCDLCGRLTRDTGTGSDSLCADCHALCSIDNHCNDSGETLAESGYAKAVAKHIANIAKRGGDVEKIKNFCSYVFPKEEA